MQDKTIRAAASFGACIVGLLLSTTASAQEPDDTTGFPKPSGFALQTSVVASTTVFTDGGTSLSLASLEGGLTFGYKTGRLMIGVGFDFTNVGQTSTQESFDPDTGMPTGTEQVTRNTYSFVVYPEIQVAIAQSTDKRAELVGGFSLGVGTWGQRRSNDTSTNDDDTDIRLRWRVGPGVRYWVHPQIGMSVTTGVTGNHMLHYETSSERDESIAFTNLYAQIGLLGVF